MTNMELIQYYAKLLIFQYRGLTKAPAHVYALLEILIILELIEDVENGYNFDTAVGKQLDILGKYIGVSRTITGVPFTIIYFGYMLYGNSPSLCIFKGYKTYGGTLPDIQELVYGIWTQSVLVLGDTEYRKILHYRMMLNVSNGSLKDIDTFLYNYFGSTIYVTDNLNKSINYTFPINQTRLSTIMKSQGLLPKGLGVGITINYV